TDSATTTGVDRSTGDAAQSWRSSFIRMPYQRDALAARGMIVETFETACTWSMFPALKAAVEAAAATAMEEVGVTGALSCRFTHVYPDGPAPYFGVYGAGEWGRTVEQWDHIKRAVSDALIAHGGTITHHHAGGRGHVPWYRAPPPDLAATAIRAAEAAPVPAGAGRPGVLLRERTGEHAHRRGRAGAPAPAPARALGCCRTPPSRSGRGRGRPSSARSGRARARC